MPALNEHALTEFFKTQGDVSAKYLFGSLAEGRATEHSDVDIAVLLADAPDLLTIAERRLQLLGQVEPFVDGEVDVVMLNSASNVLQQQVLRHGRLLYERDRDARVEFQVQAGRIYADMQPVRDFFANELMAELEEGGFGERRRRHSRADALLAERGRSPET
ncbi:MAG: nucleotidyltransferase domain-containing protein, partial [Chloroflexi bacterium]|nr:nucleotidyltransferase domain-containing protein [Chloroflexota bacterium]